MLFSKKILKGLQGTFFTLILYLIFIKYETIELFALQFPLLIFLDQGGLCIYFDRQDSPLKVQSFMKSSN